ncbi:MAG TPA: DUF1207 domain-containing protein [Methylomirabilota bacterium]|nr:DUF1207 domain-containing protein [Methylomirabilota bacterium]
MIPRAAGWPGLRAPRVHSLFEMEASVSMNRLAIALMASLFVSLGSSAFASAAVTDDAYTMGYAAAVLEREFRVTAPSLQVRDGVLTIAASDLAGADGARVEAALSRLRGVRRVIVLTAPPSPGSPAGVAGPARTAAAPSASASSASASPGSGTSAPESPIQPADVARFEILPAGLLFRPLLADPRWPAFGTTIRHYFDDSKWGTVAAVSLGDILPIVRGRAGESLLWEAGIHAAAWGLFDMDSGSADLINLDFIVGGFGSLRYGAWSGIARIFHRSTHLGDEEVINHKTNRLNFSYEGMDARVAYEPWSWLRVYAGGGYLLRVEPKNYAPWSLTGGTELRSQRTFARLRPVLGVDVQSREEHDWEPQISIRAGVELESPVVLGRNIQLLIEYFTGNSMDGQFYTRNVEYLGLGIHFKF